MSERCEEQYRDNNICRFCEIETTIDEVRDLCHLTGKYKRPSYNKSNFNFTQRKTDFIPFAFQNFSIYDCHLFKKVS